MSSSKPSRSRSHTATRSTVRVRNPAEGIVYHLVFEGSLRKLTGSALATHLAAVSGIPAGMQTLFTERGHRVRASDDGRTMGLADGVTLTLQLPEQGVEDLERVNAIATTPLSRSNEASPSDRRNRSTRSNRDSGGNGSRMGSRWQQVGRALDTSSASAAIWRNRHAPSPNHIQDDDEYSSASGRGYGGRDSVRHDHHHEGDGGDVSGMCDPSADRSERRGHTRGAASVSAVGDAMTAEESPPAANGRTDTYSYTDPNGRRRDDSYGELDATTDVDTSGEANRWGEGEDDHSYHDEGYGDGNGDYGGGSGRAAVPYRPMYASPITRPQTSPSPRRVTAAAADAHRDEPFARTHQSADSMPRKRAGRFSPLQSSGTPASRVDEREVWDDITPAAAAASGAAGASGQRPQSRRRYLSGPANASGLGRTSIAAPRSQLRHRPITLSPPRMGEGCSSLLHPYGDRRAIANVPSTSGRLRDGGDHRERDREFEQPGSDHGESYPPDTSSYPSNGTLVVAGLRDGAVAAPPAGMLSALSGVPPEVQAMMTADELTELLAERDYVWQMESDRFRTERETRLRDLRCRERALLFESQALARKQAEAARTAARERARLAELLAAQRAAAGPDVGDDAYGEVGAYEHAMNAFEAAEGEWMRYTNDGEGMGKEEGMIGGDNDGAVSVGPKETNEAAPRLAADPRELQQHLRLAQHPPAKAGSPATVGGAARKSGVHAKQLKQAPRPPMSPLLSLAPAGGCGGAYSGPGPDYLGGNMMGDSGSSHMRPQRAGGGGCIQILGTSRMGGYDGSPYPTPMGVPRQAYEASGTSPLPRPYVTGGGAVANGGGGGTAQHPQPMSLFYSGMDDDGGSARKSVTGHRDSAMLGTTRLL